MSKSSLRVAQLNSMLTGGGTDDQCVKLAKGLMQLGQRVCLIGPDGRDYSAVARSSGVPLLDTGARASKLGFIFRAAKFIRSENIEIVHGHHGRDYWPAVLAARLSGRNPKLVLTRHLAKSPGSWAGRNCLLGYCDSFVAVSEFTARVLREGHYEPDSPEAERHARPPMRGDHRKIRVIYGGIDTARFFPNADDEKRREFGLEKDHFGFAVVGGYDLPRGKGQREFLAAAARIHEKVPRARFLIIGRGTMAEVLKADIARLGLAGKAWLTPYASDMQRVMNAIDCLVHPQIGTEALGLVVCEAHACGKPVIASSLDGIPEAFAIGGYGELVEPENVDALAGAMEHEAGRRILEAGAGIQLHLKVAKVFSLERMAAEYLDHYGHLHLTHPVPPLPSAKK